MHSRKSKIIFILIFIIFNSFAFAQEEKEPKSYVIVDISVEGNKYSDPETIISLSGLRRGQQITLPGDSHIQNALKNLWQRHQFSDAEILVDKITSFGIFLVIKVKEFPRLNRIQVDNNKELTQREVVKAIDMRRGDILSKYDVYLAKQKVLQLYQEEGLIFAKVDVETESTDSSDFYNLKVWIDEGLEFYVTSVEFEGNKAFSDDELAGAFDDTHTKSWWQFWRSSKFDKNEYKTDMQLLKDFFKREGYIDAEIINDTVIYNEEEQSVKLQIYMNEGKKYYVRNIEFRGNTVYTSQTLLRRLEFKKGDVYNKELFQQNLLQNESETDCISLYLNNGFLQAQMEVDESRVEPDSVDIVVNVTERDRVKIREVRIAGNTKTKDKVIRRELFTRPGDYFSRSAVIRSIRALGVMQYFNPEALQKGFQVVPVTGDNTKVDIEYQVEEQSTDTFNASIGYAGAWGMTGSVGITLNNFAINEPLAGGAGQVFNFNWQFGQWNNNFNLGFSEPWLFDEPTTVGFNIYDSKYTYYYDIKRTGVSINLGRRFSWPDDYFRGDWSIRYQVNDIGTSSSTWYRPGRNTEITLSQTFSRISYNNLFFPTSGSKLSLSSQFAMGALGVGTTDYFKNQLKYEVVTPLIKMEDVDKLTMFLSSTMGYITGFESDDAISPIELYFMGGNGLSGFGTTPLRGYQDRSIGPEYGGRVLAHYTAELRYALSLNPMPIYVYGFAEAGNVWNSFREADPFNLKRSAGLGVQIMMMPIGLIGFSYGYGFDPVEGGTEPSGWRFLFHLGQQ